MTRWDFLRTWIAENGDNFLGKELNEAYYTYTAEAFKAGHKPYSKKTFIVEFNDMLECTTRKIFIKLKDVYCLRNEDLDD